jgi:hypothetical protein
MVAGSAVVARAPRRPRDLFAGQPVLIAVELGARGGTLELSGQMQGTSTSWTWSATMPAGDESARPLSPLPLGALYGRERLADLELSRSLAHEADRLDAEIEACGMRHRIVSSRTSLVAISEDVTVDPNAPRRRERLAVEVPDGVSVEGSGLMLASGPVQHYRIASAPALSKSMRFGAKGSDLIMGLFRSEVRLDQTWGGLADAASIPEIPATIVRVDGDLLTIEFEVPSGGLRLPRGKVMLLADDGSLQEVEVIAEHSSPAGPHAAGLRVKLTVRIDRKTVLTGGFSIIHRADGSTVWLRATASREAT